MTKLDRRIALGRARAAALLAAALLLWGLEGAAARPAQKVIYGQDDRREVFILTGQRARAAKSVVAITGPANIIDQGDGTSLLATTPLSEAMGLCPGQRFADQPRLNICSGVLVAPDIVVTAGHCMDQRPFERQRFVFGFRMKNGSEAVTRIPNADIYLGAKILAKQVGAADFAVVRLDRPVAGRTPSPIRRKGAVQRGTPLYSIGHPSGLPAKYAANATVKDASNPFFFVVNIDGLTGSSGSPLFDARDHRVIGILARAGGNENYVRAGDCRVVNVLPDDAAATEATRMTVIAPYVPQP